jgi:hypothetical protein
LFQLCSAPQLLLRHGSIVGGLGGEIVAIFVNLKWCVSAMETSRWRTTSR